MTTTHDPLAAPAPAGARNGRPPAADGDRRRNSPPSARRPVDPPPQYKLNTRQPSGLLGGCLILIEGPEYGGKTTEALELSLSDNVGPTFLMPLGAGEEVDAWSRAGYRYEIIDPQAGPGTPWTWEEIVAAVRAFGRLAWDRKREGLPPPVLIIDSFTHLWRMLSRWAETRARSTKKARAQLANDPHMDIPIGPLNWHAANSRHDDLVRMLTGMPAITIVTARGREVAVFDEGGQAMKDENWRPVKDYKVSAQGDLGFSSTAWVRVARGEHPQIIGLRLPARRGVDPDSLPVPYRKGSAVTVDPDTDRFAGTRGRFMDWLVFDVLRVDPRNTVARPAYPVEVDAVEVPGERADHDGVADATERPGAAGESGDVVEPDTDRR